MAAGITHDGLLIPGLIEDIDWSLWDRNVQYTGQFGLKGVTALDGERTTRDLTAPMIIYSNYTTLAQLQAKLDAIDEHIGEVGTFTQRDLSDTLLRTIEDVEFVSFSLEHYRFDSDLKFWARGRLVFKQLTPG